MWRGSSRRPGLGAWALVLCFWLSWASSSTWAEVVLTDEEWAAVEQSLISSDLASQRADALLLKQDSLLEKQETLIESWFPRLDSFNLTLTTSVKKVESWLEISTAQQERLTKLESKIEALGPTFDKLATASETLLKSYAERERELWVWRGTAAVGLGLALLAILN